MESIRRQILPQLPPELRNLVYQHTTCEGAPATNTGLPFQEKIFDSSHTTVTIMPVHHGLPNLLALREYNFLEAQEYASYLFVHAVELRISVVFKGNTQHFIQEHWDKKMLAHLKNLAKKYPWIKKVARYDVQILWAPVALPVRAKRKADVGEIAGRMVEVLSSLMDMEVKRKRGDVGVRLLVEDYVAVDYVFSSREMGLAKFFVGEGGGEVKRRSRAVYLAPKAALGAVSRRLLEEEKGIVRWTGWTKGDLVFRADFADGERRLVRRGSEEEGFREAWRLSKRVYLALSLECGRRV
ncbi:hypothetical protein CC80DRAFT_407988 [Byssothecium circinans]|uniref:Uncharacterized protein n=1 Tax=Byssothecium circinans TaxID=147558 RepID=A0A6A5U2G0_9PLEO|nr:hypothetical protein CC80DRAFT_407988 [Byssothecium circinans]